MSTGSEAINGHNLRRRLTGSETGDWHDLRLKVDRIWDWGQT